MLLSLVVAAVRILVSHGLIHYLWATLVMSICAFWWVLWGDEKVIFSFDNLKRHPTWLGADFSTHDLGRQDNKK